MMQEFKYLTTLGVVPDALLLQRYKWIGCSQQTVTVRHDAEPYHSGGSRGYRHTARYIILHSAESSLDTGDATSSNTLNIYIYKQHKDPWIYLAKH